MAITTDTHAKNSVDGSSVSFSYTTGTLTNGLLVAVFASRNGAITAFSNVKYNNVSLSHAGALVYNADGEILDIWYLLDPDSGAHTFIATANDAGDEIRTYLSTWDGIASYDKSADATGNGNGTVNITPTYDNCLLIAGIMSESGTIPGVGTGETDLDRTDEGVWSNGTEYVIKTTGAGVAHTMNFTGQSDYWAMKAVAFTGVGSSISSSISLSPSSSISLSESSSQSPSSSESSSESKSSSLSISASASPSIGYGISSERYVTMSGYISSSSKRSCTLSGYISTSSERSCILGGYSYEEYLSIYKDTYNLYSVTGRNIYFRNNVNLDLNDLETLQNFIEWLDDVWDAYASVLTGSPTEWLEGRYTVDGKSSMAMVTTTGGVGFSYVGYMGMEMMESYWNTYWANIRDNGKIQGTFSYEIGRNWSLDDLVARMEYIGDDFTGTVNVGYAIFMRFYAGDIAMTANPAYSWDTEATGWKTSIPAILADYYTYGYTWETTLKIGEGVAENAMTGAGDLFASFLFDLQDRYPTFFTTFWKNLQLQPASVTTQDSVDNFIVAACKTTGENLISLFVDTYKWPISSEGIERVGDALSISISASSSVSKSSSSSPSPSSSESSSASASQSPSSSESSSSSISESASASNSFSSSESVSQSSSESVSSSQSVSSSISLSPSSSESKSSSSSVSSSLSASISKSGSQSQSSSISSSRSASISKSASSSISSSGSSSKSASISLSISSSISSSQSVSISSSGSSSQSLSLSSSQSQSISSSASSSESKSASSSISLSPSSSESASSSSSQSPSSSISASNSPSESASPSFGGAEYTDNFNRADAGNLGGNWLGGSQFDIVSNHAKNTSTASDDFWNTNLSSASCYTKATIIDSSKACGVLARGNADGTSCYASLVYSGGTKVGIWKKIASTYTMVATVDVTVNNNDVLKIAVCGSTNVRIKAYINDTEILLYDHVDEDRLTSAGKSGIRGGIDAILDNFEAGVLDLGFSPSASQSPSSSISQSLSASTSKSESSSGSSSLSSSKSSSVSASISLSPSSSDSSSSSASSSSSGSASLSVSESSSKSQSSSISFSQSSSISLSPSETESFSSSSSQSSSQSPSASISLSPSSSPSPSASPSLTDIRDDKSLFDVDRDKPIMDIV